jgi:hypothetical protein
VLSARRRSSSGCRGKVPFELGKGALDQGDGLLGRRVHDDDVVERAGGHAEGIARFGIRCRRNFPPRRRKALVDNEIEQGNLGCRSRQKLLVAVEVRARALERDRHRGRQIVVPVQVVLRQPLRQTPQSRFDIGSIRRVGLGRRVRQSLPKRRHTISKQGHREQRLRAVQPILGPGRDGPGAAHPDDDDQDTEQLATQRGAVNGQIDGVTIRLLGGGDVDRANIFADDRAALVGSQPQAIGGIRGQVDFGAGSTGCGHKVRPPSSGVLRVCSIRVPCWMRTLVAATDWTAMPSSMDPPALRLTSAGGPLTDQ